MSLFSKEEREKIDELRKRVSEHFTNEAEQREDHFLIRWLRARNMNVDKAEDMLKKSLQWRRETGADTILEKEDFPEKYKKLFMFALFGEDNDGHPILLLPAGRHNHRMIIEAEGMEACMRWNIVWMEKIMGYLKEARERTGKPVYTYNEIIDMEGYSYKSFTFKPAVDYIIETQKLFDANYPDILKSVTVINAPKIFSLLFSLLKPMIAKDTLNKITIFGDDEDAWKDSFVKRGFPMQMFPPRWGGTLGGSDEFCSQESVWVDAPIPLSHFKEVHEADADGFLTSKIGARDKFELLYAIPSTQITSSDNNNDSGGENSDPNSILTPLITKISWKFKTEGHDIGFQFNFIKIENNTLKEEVIIPMKRVDSHKQLQEGCQEFNFGGTCKLIFDNRYSFSKSKILKYHVSIM